MVGFLAVPVRLQRQSAKETQRASMVSPGTSRPPQMILASFWKARRILNQSPLRQSALPLTVQQNSTALPGTHVSKAVCTSTKLEMNAGVFRWSVL